MEIHLHNKSTTSICIRPAVHTDLNGIVDVHLSAFSPSFTLTAFGSAFLRRYYELIVNFDQHIFLVAECENKVVGFAAGFTSPRIFYETLKAAKWRFIFTLFWVIIKNPLILLRVLGGLKRIKRNTKRSDLPDASTSHLCSLAVKPIFNNRGIGKALVQAFDNEARKRHASVVVITHEVDDNDAVKTVYHRLGFRRIYPYYKSKGRLIYEYVLSLDSMCDANRFSKAA